MLTYLILNGISVKKYGADGAIREDKNYVPTRNRQVRRRNLEIS
mgnify:CR=1 FL=1